SAQMEEANDSFYKELKKVIDYVNENKIKLIVDVNKKELETLKEKKLLNKIDIIRLDYGFSYEEILNMQYEDYLIELNASTVNDRLLKYLKDNHADFSRYRVSHNFYPKPYTGLSFERVKEKNEMFKKYGFTVMMWIPTISHRRLPLYRGLPTIEEQRDNNIMANISECILAKADNVFFGDAFATEEELDAAINNSKDILNIPIIVKKGISKEEKLQLERIHINRTDYSDYMIRSSIRCVNIKKFNCVKRMKKDITIDNANYKRYQGEVGIVLKEMPKDDGVNVVGRCICNDSLIDNIKGDQRFKFVIIGEE
ncbi:MAG: MupG family TIM beta-alpha barrel fold protein, partial [Bacilli bacterium]|nr:MupG family TIM beta-alpha barrel fold protein [Bacilli bacterium]